MIRNKKFTLSEIVIVIAVIALLLSVVLIKYDDFKKKSVFSVISTNVSILQSAVDQYHLRYEKYPTKQNSTLTGPQFVDSEVLLREGFIKKDLYSSKLKNQLYWIDVFGRVWGSTQMPPTNVSIIEKKGQKNFEFTLEGDVIQYNIYEVFGYKEKTTLSYKDIDIQKPNDRVALADGSAKYYRLVDSKEVSLEGPTSFTYEGKNKGSTYLISTVDSYGLESVPYGLSENNYFAPLLSFEGKREFEIEGSKKMYWVDFFTLEETPEGTSINYRFKVKDENGKYGEWSADFYKLKESKGIIVEVEMKGNGKGEKPSLYDLRISYTFDGKPVVLIPNPPLILPPEELDPIPPNKGTINIGGGSGGGTGTGGGSGGGTGTGGGSGGGTGTGGGSGGGTGTGGGSGGGTGTGGGSGGGTGTGGGSGGGAGTGGGPDSPVAQDICPEGYGLTNVKRDGTAIDPEVEKQLSYLIVLQKGEMLNKVTMPKVSNATIIDTIIQYAKLNSKDKYVEVDSIRSIPEESCVNILYTIETEGPPTIDGPPGVQIGPPVKIDTSDPKEEWTTVEVINFVGHSEDGTEVKWTGLEKSAYTPMNTRIVEEFSYLSNGGWSGSVSEIESIPNTRSVLAKLTLQVKTNKIKDPKQENPEVSKLKLIYEGGKEFDYSTLKPMVLINPTKDNNEGRMIFSTESNINWDVWSFDPLGREIVDIEWDGDKQDKYSKAGSYVVKARVKNLDNVWSDWNEYKFTVYGEKPVAKLNSNKMFLKIGEKIDWDNLIFDISYDPDQDGIVEREWGPTKKDSYTEDEYGEIKITLRVKDAEGNWSDWLSQTAFVYDSKLWVNISPKGYDNDLGTREPIKTQQRIYWLEDLTDRKVTLNLNSEKGTGVLTVQDVDGKQLEFLNTATNFYTSSLGISASNNQIFSFVIPENADSIHFAGYSSLTSMSLNEISVSSLETELPVFNGGLVAIPNITAVNLKFEANGNQALIYRNGAYLNKTSLNYYTDSVLFADTKYSYEVVLQDAHGNISKKEKIDTKTLERDITFYGPSNLQDNLQKAFDYDFSTVIGIPQTNTANRFTVKWKYKEGFSQPETLKGQSILLKASSSISSGNLFRVVDKDGKSLTYQLYNGTRLVSNSATVLTTTATEYYIVLPEGAAGVEFYGNTVNNTAVYIYDIRFNSNLTTPNTIQNIKVNPSYTSVSMTWEKEASVSRVSIYRDSVYIGYSDTTSFTDPTVLESKKSYKYSFEVATTDKRISWVNPIETTTLERNITFFTPSNLQSNILRAFDYDLTTLNGVSQTNMANRFTVNWRYKDGYNPPKTLKGQSILLKASSNVSNGNLFRVVDKDGKSLTYQLYNGTRLVSNSATVLTTTATEYYIVLPEGAAGIEFYGNTVNSTVAYLYDIRFYSNLTAPNTIQNIKVNPLYTSASMTWEKEANVSRVSVYRDGFYIGYSDTNSFVDPTVLESKKSYKYSFEVATTDKRISWVNPIETTTLERNITFFTPSNLQSNILRAFDYDLTTVNGVSQTNTANRFTVNWRYKDGYNPPKTLKGQTLLLKAYSNVSNGNLFRVVDKDGKPLIYQLYDGTRLVTYSATAISTSITEYYIVLPEGAAGIEFYGSTVNSTVAYLYDIRFYSNLTAPNTIQNVKVNPLYTSASMTWEKEASVSRVSIYRDGVYIGYSDTTSFTDPSVLESGKSYKYSFEVATTDKRISWVNPIETKTLERNITFSTPSVLQTTLLRAFDYDLNTVVGVGQTNTVNRFTVNWRYKAGYNPPETLKGQTILIKVYSNTSNGNSFRVVDKDGKPLTYQLHNGTRLVSYSATAISTSITEYYIVLPEGAAGIEFYGNNATNAAIYLYDIRFYSDMKEPKTINNVTFNPTYNNISMSWEPEVGVSSVAVYRNGAYLGNTTSNTYVDTTYKENNITYKYSFEVFTSDKKSTSVGPFDAKMLERNYTFYPNTLKTSLVNSFDMNLSTFSTMSQNTTTNKFNVHWRFKEGFKAPESMEGQVVRVRAKSNIGNGNVLKIINKDGNAMTFHRYDANNVLYATNVIYLSTVITDYDIVLPRNAAGIEIYGNSSTNTTYALSLYEVYAPYGFVEIETLNNVSSSVTNEAVRLEWEKEKSIHRVQVYRNGVLLGTTTEEYYEDKTALTGGTYNYSFIAINNSNLAKWVSPIQVTITK